jgi:Uma2 family endonuclease
VGAAGRSGTVTVVLADRTEMAESDELTLDELFERLEHMPAPEGFKVEIVEGTVYMSPQRSVHWDLIACVYEELRTKHPRKRLKSDVRIDFPGHLNGFCPDLVLLKEGAQEDSKGRWDYRDIEFVLEVISKGTGPNDYGPKKAVYAEAGVPVYLVVDPFTTRCRLFTHPHGRDYKSELTVVFGEPIKLEDTPVGLTISTEEFEGA